VVASTLGLRNQMANGKFSIRKCPLLFDLCSFYMVKIHRNRSFCRSVFIKTFGAWCV